MLIWFVCETTRIDVFDTTFALIEWLMSGVNTEYIDD